MAYAYPAPAPTLSGDIETISRFLNSPTVIARRLRTLAEQRYIADTLLAGRFQVQGGAVLYETGESIFTADNPRAVAPGSEYPLTIAPTGQASMAKTVKWGQDTYISDEAIARQNFQPVDKAMIKLVNQNVKYVDSVALSAIASGITATQAAAASWATSTAQQKLTDVATAKAQILALNQGYSPDTVVVDDLTWAYAYASFTGGGFLPREQTENSAVSGNFAVIDGMRWLSTPNLPTTGVVLVVDSTMLGGMADEDLGGPGYTQAGGIGVQAKTIRDDEADRWRMRMRRVTVPIVVEPAAGRKITNV
jgi:hypothetical protein